MVFQQIGNDLIVELPKGQNGHKREADQRGAFDVEFHGGNLLVYQYVQFNRK